LKKSTKKAILGAGIITVGFSAIASATYILTNFLVKVALERNGVDKIKENPKAKKILLGSEENVDFMNSRKNLASEFSKKEKEIVEIESFDGTKLVGEIYHCESPKRIIIAMHGWRSSCGEDFGAMVEFFKENHCTVLYTHQRGQGDSEGNYMGFGLVERYDCFEWVKYITSREQLPIYLAGVSMGATTVLMASSFELPETVKGIIADCGFTSPHAILKHVANNNLKLAYGLIGMIADDMVKKKIKMGTKDYSVAEAMKLNKLPVLFIHGTDDNFVPISMTFENYKSCTAPKKLLVVPGADHAMSYYTAPAEYEKSLLEFWEEFDSYDYSTTEE
jgi:pimeloyl-ACP methyl ester carboxylesterase